MLEEPGPRPRPADGAGDDVRHGQGSTTATPSMLIRTLEGCITFWSPGMVNRYGFTSSDALGRTSHQLLGTVFPRTLPEIEAVLAAEHAWRGGVIHRHADGRPIMTVNHWFLSRDGADQDWRVSELHSDVVPGGEDAYDQVADLLEMLTHELSEPLTAIRNYLDGSRRILQSAWPDLHHLREALTQMRNQIARGSVGVRLLRALAVAMRDTE